MTVTDDTAAVPPPPPAAAFESDHDDPRSTAADAAMRAQGIDPYESGPIDYFGVEETLKVMLPDGHQWIEHKVFNEGQRKAFQNKVNRDVKFQKSSGDAVMRLAPGDERHALLSSAITGWYLVKGGQPFPFNPRNRDVFLDQYPPKIIDLVEKAVKAANPWLLAEMSLEDMLKERDNLDDMIQIKRQEEEGKADSLSS